MELQITLNGNLLDYVDIDEVKSDIAYEIKKQIKEQLAKIVEEHKSEIENQLVQKTVQEILSITSYKDELTEKLEQKVKDFIDTRYSKSDDLHLGWDLDISKKVQDIYDKQKEVYDKILKDKIDEALKEYRVDNYAIAQSMSNILTNEEKYKTIMEELLSNKLNDILDKLI